MKLQEPLWHQILVQINKLRVHQRYISRIHRKLRGSLTHLRIITQKLEDFGFIRIVPTKNKKMIELTAEGEKVATAILTLKKEINNQIVLHERK